MMPTQIAINNIYYLVLKRKYLCIQEESFNKAHPISTFTFGNCVFIYIYNKGVIL
jgi:hypothetical protein